MPQNIFKIYDGRTNFWQWDRGQKLIVLDPAVTQVHFSNRDMKHSIPADVYEYNGKRVCNVPDLILTLPRNLIAYAYVEGETYGRTVKSVKFAVIQRPIPDDYVVVKNEQVDDISRRLEILENVLKDIELGRQTLTRFESLEEAESWAQESKQSGIVVAVHVDGKWIAHMVEDDYSVTPICDCNGNMVVIGGIDGGNGNGYNDDEDEFSIWDGGGAAGI